jgi:transposase
MLPGSDSRTCRNAYHPATLLGILVYGYATGVFSSRRLEQATYDSVAFRFIAANLHPDHDSLAAFRRRFLDELSDLFLQILEMAKEMKVLKVGNICLDGTKMEETVPAPAQAGPAGWQ